jgi:hypothetical protein
MSAKIPGNLLTTAMAVMPHTDVERALEMALSLDVPFWPQLPHYSYYEDMYVQAAEHFPGIILDLERRTLRFSIDKFAEEIEAVLARFDDPALFDISETYSAVYHRFLTLSTWTWRWSPWTSTPTPKSSPPTPNPSPGFSTGAASSSGESCPPVSRLSTRRRSPL